MSQLCALDCYRVPVLERERALQILGLSDGAEPSEIHAAHRALRAHVEARSQQSDEAAFREERRNELRDLERVLRALDSLPTPRGIIEASPPLRARRLVPRWVLGWALVATLLAAGLSAYLSTLEGVFGPAVIVGGSGEGGDGSGGFAIEGEGESDGDDGGDGDVESAGERARLVAKSPVEGAILTVRTRGDVPEVVAEGAADETVYWIAPGEYALRVAHEDCQSAWEQDLDVVGGDEHSFEPEPCQDVGWLVVQSNVPQDELSIDGEKAGTSGEEPRPLSAGEHEVRVAKSGFRAWEGIIDVEAGRVIGIRPRLQPAAKAAPKPKPAPPQQPKQQQPQVAADAPREREQDRSLDEGWHEQARQWLLSRYDLDRSGALDTKEELESVPCDRWLGLEASHSQSRLGLSFTRFYGFDGIGWRSGALGVSDEIRDLAYERMKHCGLR